MSPQTLTFPHQLFKVSAPEASLWYRTSFFPTLSLSRKEEHIKGCWRCASRSILETTIVLTSICATVRTWAIAAAIAPLIAGVLASHGQWRWFFCECLNSCRSIFQLIIVRMKVLNLPLCSLALAVVFFYLDVPTPPGSLPEKLAKIDFK